MIQFLFLQFLQVYFLFYAKYTILCICLFDNLHVPSLSARTYHTRHTYFRISVHRILSYTERGKHRQPSWWKNRHRVLRRYRK